MTMPSFNFAEIQIYDLQYDFEKPGIRLLHTVFFPANLRFVVKIAMDFQKHWMQNFMGLTQEGL